MLEAAIAKLGLEIDVEALAKQISVTALSGTQLVGLKVEGADLSQALLLADTIAEVFIGQMQTLQEEPYISRMSNLQDQMDRLQL